MNGQQSQTSKCKFTPGKLYHIRYKGWAIPIELDNKIIFCLETKKHTGARKKTFHVVKVLLDGKILKFCDFSYKTKEIIL